MLREFRDFLLRGNLVAAVLGRPDVSGLEFWAAARRCAPCTVEVGAA